MVSGNVRLIRCPLIIGGVFIVWDSKRAYYLLGGYDHQNSHHGATALAMWRAIQYTSNELELSEFDFKGSMIKSVKKFFRQFGGELTPCYRVTKYSGLVKLFYFLRNLYGGSQ